MGLIWSTPIIGRERSGSSQGLGKDREESVKCHKGSRSVNITAQKDIEYLLLLLYIISLDGFFV